MDPPNNLLDYDDNSFVHNEFIQSGIIHESKICVTFLALKKFSRENLVDMHSHGKVIRIISLR